MSHVRRRMPRVSMAAYLGIIGSVLPGDHIHHVAPINAQQHDSRAMIDALDAAKLKRMRRMEKRRGQVK